MYQNMEMMEKSETSDWCCWGFFFWKTADLSKIWRMERDSLQTASPGCHTEKCNQDKDPVFMSSPQTFSITPSSACENMPVLPPKK